MAEHFEFTSSALPSNAKVAAFRGSEGISRPYVFDIYVQLEGDEVDVDDSPGARGKLTINDAGAEPITVNGIIASMELLQSVAVNDDFSRVTSLYRLQLVPNVWQLSLTKHSRLWSGKSIPDVIKEVLDDEGVADFELRLEGAYDVEEHVCQYKESSLNFIQRWMERLGMYYFFEQGDQGEKLVITDNKATSVPSVARPIPYHPNGGDGSARAHLEMFTWRHTTTPMAVRYTDYDYAKPTLEMIGDAAVSKFGAGEQVTYGGRFFTRQQGETLANVRAEDIRARAKTFQGSGAVYGLSSGYRFTVDRHPRAQLNIEYLAVSVEHFGTVTETVSAWGKAFAPHDHIDQVYRVEFTAIDASQQYRHPEVAAWPRLDGFENAVVDGPANSEYAQIDDHGRYKVKFKFDEGTLKGGQATTWVRKMQPHAGTVEGWHFPERAGTEVICAFLGGDPDRPIIIGAVPTVTTQSPVTSSNHTQNVIQTGGKNRFEMEDLAGQQRVTMSTPHQSTFISLGHPLTGVGQVYNGDATVPDHHIAISTDGNTFLRSGATTDNDIGANWNVWVHANHVEQISGNVVHQVAGTVEQEIEGTLLQEVVQGVTEAYHSTLTQGVQGAVELTHHTGYTHSVSGGLTHEIFNTGQTTEISGGDHNHAVTGNQINIISANRTTTITGTDTLTVTGAVTETWQSAKNSATHGACYSFYGGFKNDTTVGIFFSECLAAKFELSATAKFSITAAASYELVPNKFRVNVVKTDTAAAKTEAVAAKDRMLAIENSLTAVRSFTVAAAKENHALISKTGAVYSSVSALRSHMAGLHSQA